MAHHATHQPTAHGLRAAAGKDDTAREAGRLLFAAEARFAAAAGSPQSLPRPSLPEIAFAGRSNVGKSSLINALLGRKNLVRTSRTPGRTQQINFFDLGGRLMLVDLPGYGYAHAPKTAIEAWNTLVEAYLRGRASLRRTMLLVDARHGLKDTDRATMGMLDKSAAPYQLVLTKADKAGAGALAETRAAVADEAARHPAAHPDIMAVSAVSGDGLPELRAALAQFAQPQGERRT
jgi:GTP-binding protein